MKTTELTKLIITEELEKKSIFGVPHIKSYYWYWVDDRGNIGFLSAITEMEALDRLREAFEEVGAIKWITHSKYEELTN